MSDRFSESGDLRQGRMQYIDQRWKGFADQLVVRLDAAVTYLMLANSGGAVAVLGFMGAMRSTTPIHGAPTMLGLFLSGIVLVGVLRAIHYYRIAWLFASWRADVDEFFADLLGWKDMLERDRLRSRRFWLADVVALLSFAFFIAGVYVGYRGLLPGG